MNAGLPTLQRHEEDGVAVLQLDNPPLNLLTVAVRERIIELTSEIAEDDAVGAVLLRGAGKGFSAGSDVREFPDDLANGRRRARLEHRCADALEQLPQPVIGALHGHVLGGGLELALACDLRMAADATVFGFPEIRLGVFPSGGGTFRARREIGAARAKELMLLGKNIDAERAHQLGLVNRLTEDEQLQTEGYRLACQVAAQPRLASRAVKEALRATDQTARATEEHLIAELFASDDAQEGVRAFLEKRQARFEQH